MKKQLPNSISTAELLEALENYTPDITEESPEPETVPEFRDEYNDILVFCSKYSIYPGNNPIRVQLLYKLYKLSTHHPVNYTRFKSFILDYLIYVTHTTMNLHVLINKDNLILSKEVETLFLKKKIYRINGLAVKRYEKAMKLFMEECNVSVGKSPIEAETLYFFYDKWCYKRRKVSIPFISFKRLCTLFFTQKSTKTSECTIKINKSFLTNLPPEELATAKKWGKLYAYREKNKKI